MDKRSKWMLGIVFGTIAIVWAIMIPMMLMNRSAEKFAAPLFEHSVPAGGTVLQSQTKQGWLDGWSGGICTNAVLLLECDLDQAALETFYSDIEYPPARSGDTVELTVRPLDDASLQALQQAGQLDEDGQYWFIYLYSSAQ